MFSSLDSLSAPLWSRLRCRLSPARHEFAWPKKSLIHHIGRVNLISSMCNFITRDGRDFLTLAFHGSTNFFGKLQIGALRLRDN
jgi:hypothetical protein